MTGPRGFPKPFDRIRNSYTNVSHSKQQISNATTSPGHTLLRALKHHSFRCCSGLMWLRAQGEGQLG